MGLLLAGTGCNESSFFVKTGYEDPGVSPGVVQGRVCDPSGRTWLADALVYTHMFTSGGELYETRKVYSDRDGYWYIDSLPGDREYTFYVQYGDSTLEEYTVWVGDGEELTLDEPDCFDPLSLDVAVIAGDYDDFQLVLSNMGFGNYHLVDGLLEADLEDFLLDSESMGAYDIIFFNGGHVEEDIIYDLDGSQSEELEEGETPINERIMTNIANYVRDGGAIYASDWAYDVVEQGWPDRLEFVGDDTIPDDAQLGEYDLVTAAISDASLAAWLGNNSIEVEYDLPVWPPMEGVDGAVTTHLSGNVSYRIGQSTYTLAAVPLLASFSSGEGKVVFSTFRVAKNGSSDMMQVLQYMMYNL
jgi:hypothetical protein